MNRVNLSEFKDDLRKMNEDDIELSLNSLDELLSKTFIQEKNIDKKLKIAKYIYSLRKLNYKKI